MEEAGPPEIADEGVLAEALDLFSKGSDRRAINALYDEVVVSTSKAHNLTLEPNMTHWEKYEVIQAAIPDARAPLRTLTVAYELTNYRNKSLTKEQREAATDAFRAISKDLHS